MRWIALNYHLHRAHHRYPGATWTQLPGLAERVGQPSFWQIYWSLWRNGVQPAPPMGAPFNRILWSVQAGVVLTTAGAGLWLAKNGILDEAAQAMQVVAILTMALGVGFVLSALASYGLSRQLGLVNSPADHA
jgi:heme/copper-type cytochrome/quinol oxidase subunit 3